MKKEIKSELTKEKSQDSERALIPNAGSLVINHTSQTIGAKNEDRSYLSMPLTPGLKNLLLLERVLGKFHYGCWKLHNQGCDSDSG